MDLPEKKMKTQPTFYCARLWDVLLHYSLFPITCLHEMLLCSWQLPYEDELLTFIIVSLNSPKVKQRTLNNKSIIFRESFLAKPVQLADLPVIVWPKFMASLNFRKLSIIWIMHFYIKGRGNCFSRGYNRSQNVGNCVDTTFYIILIKMT